MPIYEYRRSKTSSGCDVCVDGFEAVHKMSDPRITSCPECDGEVERVMSVASFSTREPSATTLAHANVEKKGFTRYERAGPGSYVKTAGNGPTTLSR